MDKTQKISGKTGHMPEVEICCYYFYIKFNYFKQIQ